MTKQEQLVEDEINKIVEKKYCKHTVQCQECKKWEDCKTYDCGVFEKVAIQMILKLRKEKKAIIQGALESAVKANKEQKTC